MNWSELPGLFITGTDTGVGKTYVTALLLRELIDCGHKVLPCKPICCGDPDDIIALAEASGHTLEADEINPCRFQSPVAPLAAGRIEGHFPDITELAAHTRALSQKCDLLLVEGAGGWHVPLTEKENLSDLARAIDLPILLIVNNRLGALNHTLLTLEAIKNSGQTCLGIILNHLEEERDLATVTNPTLLRELTDVPILAEVLTGGDFIDWLDPTHAP